MVIVKFYFARTHVSWRPKLNFLENKAMIGPFLASNEKCKEATLRGLLSF